MIRDMRPRDRMDQRANRLAITRTIRAVFTANAPKEVAIPWPPRKLRLRRPNPRIVTLTAARHVFCRSVCRNVTPASGPTSGQIFQHILQQQVVRKPWVVRALLRRLRWIHSSSSTPKSPECGPGIVVQPQSRLRRQPLGRECSLGWRTGRSPARPSNSPA